VGKTTTAINLAAALVLAGKNTLIADLDPQANASSGLGLVPPPAPSSSSLLSGFVKNAGGLSGLNLVSAGHLLHSVEKTGLNQVAEDLYSTLNQRHGSYDFLFLDCPPSLGNMTELGILVADEVLIPVQCEYFAMEALARVAGRTRHLAALREKDLKISGILLTMFEPQFSLSREVTAEIKSHFPDLAYETIIPRDIALSEAAGFGKHIFDYAPRSQAAFGYARLAKEVLSYGGKEIRSGA
jgi:chromosome partitioning protein